MCKKYFIYFCPVFVILYSVLFYSSVYSATLSISGASSKLNGDNEEYYANILLNISANDGTVYYLRGVFYKPSTSNYCGYTWNGNTYFKGPYSTNEGWKNFLPITVQQGSWSGQLKAKIDIEDNACKEPGTYNFKIQRFTQNSSSGSFDSQEPQSIEVNFPTQTPIPSDIPKPTNTLVPTKTPVPEPTSAPTKTPTPSKTPTPTSTPKKSPTPTKIKDNVEGAEDESLPIEDSNIFEASEEAYVATESEKSAKEGIFITPAIFFILGTLCLVGMAISIYKTKKTLRNNKA